jgi:hypothetical protein
MLTGARAAAIQEIFTVDPERFAKRHGEEYLKDARRRQYS